MSEALSRRYQHLLDELLGGEIPWAHLHIYRHVQERVRAERPFLWVVNGH